MKSPPVLTLGSESLRADAANQAMAPTHVNHSSAVSYSMVWWNRCQWQAADTHIRTHCRWQTIKTQPLTALQTWTSTFTHFLTHSLFTFEIFTYEVTPLEIFPFLTISLCVHQRGLLYQGLHGGSSMIAMSKAGLLGHSLGAYSLPSPATPGLSANDFKWSVWWCFLFAIIRSRGETPTITNKAQIIQDII